MQIPVLVGLGWGGKSRSSYRVVAGLFSWGEIPFAPEGQRSPPENIIIQFVNPNIFFFFLIYENNKSSLSGYKPDLGVEIISYFDAVCMEQFAIDTDVMEHLELFLFFYY